MIQHRLTQYRLRHQVTICSTAGIRWCGRGGCTVAQHVRYIQARLRCEARRVQLVTVWWVGNGLELVHVDVVWSGFSGVPVRVESWARGLARETEERRAAV